MEIQWSLLLFSLIAGTGGSLLAFLGVGELLGVARKSRKPLLVAVLVLVVVGGLCSVLHLEQKANIMAAAANVFSFSPISTELIMVGFAFVIGAVYLVCVIKEVNGTAVRVIGVLGIVAGVALGFVTGDGYRMGAQPNWNTITLPLAYLATDLSAGGALYLAGISALKDAEGAGRALRGIWLALSALSCVLCAAYGVVGGFEAQFATFAATMVFSLITLGCAVCTLLKDKLLPASAIGVVCALVAGACLRAFMWLLGTGTLDLFTAAAAHAVL